MLSGKIAIITGSGSGIGKATAKIFVRENIKGIAIVDYNYEAACKTAEELGAMAFPVKCDVSKAEDVERAAKEIYDHFGRVDILVNNAGITRDAMFHKMTMQQWEQVINTNLNGVFYWCKAVINGMREQEYGRIVNISSMSARGNVGQANYAATKAALIGFTSTLAKENARKNISCNCVAPGATNTDMYMAVPQKVIDSVTASNPTKRLGEPNEIGEVVAFLASERASYLNGQWIPVNGGK